MLNSISWDDYIKVIFVVTTIYYAVCILLLYQKQIKSKLQRSTTSQDEVRGHDHDESGIIGRIANEDQPSVENSSIQSDQISIAEYHKSEMPNKEIANGLASASAFLDELKRIVTKVSKDQDNKETTVFLLKEFFTNPEAKSVSMYKDSIILLLHNSLSGLAFKISIEELQSLWPDHISENLN